MIGHISERAGVMARLALSPLFAFAAVIGTTASTADAKGVQNNVPAELQTAFQTITSGGPLSEIFLGVDIAAQIAHTGDTDQEIYPPGTMPGDYGTFLVVGAQLYAPDFANHGGSASGGIGSYITYTPISQSAVSGSGTSGDPFTVTTVVGIPVAGLDGVGTGLTITQVDSYVVGQESYRTDVTVANSSAAPVDAILYRAMDCYLGGSDSGYGMLNGTAVGCSANPNNVPAGRIEQIVPLTAGNNYYQSFYGSVWTAIGTHLPFPDTCDCNIQQDNGAGISWNITIPAGGSVTRSNVTVFSPTGAQALFVSKTADIANVAAGASDGYTITVNNPGVDATLNSITDTLPAGFTYTAGSSTGVTTADPTIAAQVLTWAGPFAVSAGSSVTLHFGVTASTVDGTYTNQASADAGAGGVASTGATAPVTVGGGGPPTGAITLPTLSSGMLAALVLIMLFAGLYARRARR
jgi:uncharacterized repeat protein (TIGR01451 family)